MSEVETPIYQSNCGQASTKMQGKMISVRDSNRICTSEIHSFEWFNSLEIFDDVVPLDDDAREFLSSGWAQAFEYNSNRVAGKETERNERVGVKSKNRRLAVIGGSTVASDQFKSTLKKLKFIDNVETEILVIVKNATEHSFLASLIEGDFTLADNGASALQSRAAPSSVFKLLLDEDWLPTILGGRRGRRENPSHNINPRSEAAKILGQFDEIYIHAKFHEDSPDELVEESRFTVVVPTTNEKQLQANVISSPGIEEVGAKIITVKGASSASDALEEAFDHIDTPWILMIHQDVYLPKSFGKRLSKVLSRIPKDKHKTTLIGFSGIGVDTENFEPVPAGLVLDRINLFDKPNSQTVISIDELGIVLHRESLLKIDASLGWHLWATDLCLVSIEKHKVFPSIIRIPLFHNSASGWSLPSEFYHSAKLILEKHEDFEDIPTLCGTINHNFINSLFLSK